MRPIFHTYRMQPNDEHELSYKPLPFQFLDDDQYEADAPPPPPSFWAKLETSHKTDLTFSLLVAIGFVSIFSFLKLGLKSVPVVVFSLILYAWTIIHSELKGFLPEELGFKKAFGGVQISILILLILLQFFAGILGILSY